MRLLVLPWSLAAALRFSSQSDQPVRRVYGPENRHCRLGVKGSTEVIGGTLVEDEGRYPFLAWLGDDDGTDLSQFCGGSLIHPQIVMTAGHCLYESDYWNSQLMVRFRLTNFANTTGVKRKVINWRRHEKYSRAHVLNDISLLFLESPVNITPVDLSLGNETHEQTDAVVTGWGSTDEECRQYDTYLRDATVTIGPKGPNCSTPGSRTLTESDFSNDMQMCAGIYTPGGMQYPGCGDSGGPLLIRNDLSRKDTKKKTPYTQVGMVSWSYGIPWPDVFTRVSYFKDWIAATQADFLANGTHPYLRDD